ncbi:serine protease nudel [Maniola hyperantus]|uniref:serine protease nudel n=1 Tax=Aphantopus hyperantus TaxID=2795564 RepID=UPI0015687FC4|nr:serine protease nudel isoform X2 [Maniola hyperantus]
MAPNTEEKKPVSLLPMDLAETNNGKTGLKWYPVLQKILAILFIILFAVGFYILILRLLQNDDNIHNTEIIVVSALREGQNMSVLQDKMKIFFLLNNKTFSNKRRKRETISVPKNSAGHTRTHNNVKFKDNEIQRLRKMLSEHEVLCNEESHKDVCKELVMKIKLLTETSFSGYDNKNGDLNAINNIEANNKNKVDKILADISKRETAYNLVRPTKSVTMERDTNPFGFSKQISHPHLATFPREARNSQLTDTCLLARLMRQSFPELQDVYDNPQFDYQSQISPYSSRHVPSSYYSVHNQDREVDLHKHKPHPQDIEIAMRFIEPKHDSITTKDASLNFSVNEVECPDGAISCNDGSACVEEKQWCDGKVDCSDVSDEARCTCKSRVDVARICDGYFDCPFGEDEMGCFGCSESTFSCEDVSSREDLRSTCFSKEQRCNNIADCPNHKDEIDCSMLAPSLHKKPLFAISNTEGFLLRNYKGNWYAVCDNPYMWAHDACRRETGLIIRPPFIQVLSIDPLLKVDYINTVPGGLIHTSNTCLNSSAVYVTCPDLLCGTRMLTSSQLIKEDAAIESRLFGRNKRFLLPYPAIFYDGRVKRHVTNKNANSDLIFNYLSKGRIDETRNKRAEGRVVGGKPSQPTAWPWVVALYRDGMFHCGGVIINQNWIMSAAHCVHKFWQHYYEVQVGMLRRFSFSPQEQNHRVTHIIVNQNYNQETMKNDLSLLRVKPGMQFSRWARPICLPSREVAGSDWKWGPAAGTICTAVGWGATKERGPDPDHMREVEIPIWERCKHEEDQSGKEICAGLMEGGKDACQGDSGGPLLCRNPINAQQWYVAGIVSHGDGCGRKDEPGVYTRVSLFVPWIKYHISSKRLPVIQPKQECPGFRCDSGILKCLPKKRMCDKIIDCLDGEDELNCDVDTLLVQTEKSSIQENSSLTRKVSEKLNENKSKEMEKNDNSASSEKNSKEDNNHIKVTTDKSQSTTLFDEVNSDSKEFSNEENSKIESTTLFNSHVEHFTLANNALKLVTDLDTSANDLKYVSTVEFSNTDYSQEIGKAESIDENVTLDPINILTNEEPEQHSVKIDTSKYPLQSMSSIVENNSYEVIKKEKSEYNKLMATTSVTQPSPSTLAHSDDPTTTDNHKFRYNLEHAIKNIESDKSKTAKESHELIIELLPRSNFTSDDIKNTLSEKDGHDQKISATNHVENNTDAQKPLDSKDSISKIEDITFLELQPAKTRKKNLTPMEFQCRRIYQTVPYATRCDHKPDCEDGTDESDCTCLDYLTTYDRKLICDGNFDCADGQDEIDCFTCEENHFLCKRSQICLDTKYICDGTPQCPLGEDELDCFTLSNGKHIIHDSNGRPQVNLEGYITKKLDDNNWQIVCEKDMPIKIQEESAIHICRYLGFSSANRYLMKYINMKDSVVSSVGDNKKNKRDIGVRTPVHFTFKTEKSNNSLKNIIINEPEIIKEECVPNITKTCMTLYVYCEHSLFTHFDVTQDLRTNTNMEYDSFVMWPWIAKLYVDGKYKCTGVLVDLSWVLISHHCLQRYTLSHHYITIVLGSHYTLDSTIGPYEQVYQVDAKKDLYRSRVILLHLKDPAVYAVMVKPMVVTSSFSEDTKNTICVAVGQTKNNKTFNVFLKETDDCDLHNRCFIRQRNESTCYPGEDSEWNGIISCHTKQGWYPAASFVEKRIDCGNRIIGTDIGNLKHEIKYYEENPLSDSVEENLLDECEGARCLRGKCVELQNICNGVTDCEDGADELKDACRKKHDICTHDPLHRGCECPVGQLKCNNGRCVLKEFFKDGHDDCGDGTDEPGHTKCSDYLRRVMPSRLCDGILHCQDRSDEDPMFCKCHAKKGFKCTTSSTHIEDYCVAFDMVCDGVRDCPNGEDEKNCIGLIAPKGTPHGTGEVTIRSHGVWHSKCYPTQNHTRSQLEAICREVGFISGHAKQLSTLGVPQQDNKVVVDTFSDITLNNNTNIKLRNSDAPMARTVVEENENCYPVFIECL